MFPISNRKEYKTNEEFHLHFYIDKKALEISHNIVLRSCRVVFGQPDNIQQINQHIVQTIFSEIELVNVINSR